MKYLLDTNVLSELGKDSIDPYVAAWFDGKSQDSLLISAITIGEVVYGIERLPDGKRKDQLQGWFDETLVDWFEGRVCAIDAEVMRRLARIKAAGRTLPILDSLIAATAIAQGATLVTRNTKDYDGISGLSVVNPFGASAATAEN